MNSRGIASSAVRLHVEILQEKSRSLWKYYTKCRWAGCIAYIVFVTRIQVTSPCRYTRCARHGARECKDTSTLPCPSLLAAAFMQFGSVTLGQWSVLALDNEYWAVTLTAVSKQGLEVKLPRSFLSFWKTRLVQSMCICSQDISDVSNIHV